MTLSTGTRLGPYTITSPLGAGGMGEVYRARDTRLGRDVAVKVLSSHLSENEEARARFEAEARTVSSFNHPHICTLFDVGREGTTDYLVMELLEGETLSERLSRGALPLADVLGIGVQIAGALDRAHRAGIVHRDLKPGNVMLTRTGAKLMDFGLARATGIRGPAGSGGTSGGVLDAPTLGMSLTSHGSVVGTLPYMAPEQIEGREADARSDVWALGCVLYEMATGRRAFEAASTASMIAGILERQPSPLGDLAGVAPPGFERVITRCLAKDPDERWQSVSDLGSELAWISEGGSQTALQVPAARRRVARPRLAWWLAAASAAVALAALAYALRSGHGREPLAFRQLNFRHEAIFGAAFTARGDSVVYSAATSGNTPRIFSVRRDYPEPQPVGPPGMHLLAVSSQGELAVLVGARYVWHRMFVGTLARMSLSGGAPREIVAGVRQADWSPDGSQLAILREVGGRDRLEYPIDHVLVEASGYMSDLRVSPQGNRIAYFEHPRKWDDRGSVNVVDLGGKKTVLSDGYWSERGLAWSPDGHEVLFSASVGGGSYTVYAVTMSGKRRIAYQPPGGLTIEDVAADGRWLASRVDFRYAALVHTPDLPGDRDLSWLNTSHVRALSQDGKMLLFAETALGNNYTACLRKTDGSPVLRLGEGWPTDLSSDGSSVLAVIQSLPPRLVVYPTGPGEIRSLARGNLENYSTAQWFPDGKRVLLGGNEPGKGTRLYVQEIGGEPRPVTPEGTRSGLLSSDGSTILARGPGGGYVLYPIDGGAARPLPGLAEEDVVAHWSRDGRWVVAYRPSEIPCRLERVDLATGERSLFEELAPDDREGLLSLREIFLTDDLRSYAYTAYYQTSSLFVSEKGE